MLNFIGSDSGFGNNNTSAYIIKDNKFILIDCGFTVFNKIKDIIVNYDDIDILISHLHNDHAGSLSQIILYLYYVYNKKVRIVSKCEKIKEYLYITDVTEDMYTLVDSTDYLEIIKTKHGKTIDAYGFKLNINNKKIIYTADTISLDLFLPYMDDIDELYTDCSAHNEAHPNIDSIKDILDNLSKKGIKIYLIHTDDKEYIRNVVNNKYEVI